MSLEKGECTYTAEITENYDDDNESHEKAKETSVLYFETNASHPVVGGAVGGRCVVAESGWTDVTCTPIHDRAFLIKKSSDDGTTIVITR